MSKKTLFTRRVFEAFKFAASGKTPESIAADYDIDQISGGRPDYKFDWSQNLVDDLVRVEGYGIYDSMMKDGEVSSAVWELIHDVISADWDVTPATQDDSTSTDSDIEIADFCRWTLNDMEGSVVGVVEETLDAIGKGLSVGEMNLKVIKSGKWVSKWGFKDVKYQDPQYIDFTFEKSGRLAKMLQQNPTGGGWTNLPLEKFLVFTFRPQYGRVWGQSLLRTVYRHWFSKKFLIKWWAMYLEKFGDPTVIGTFPGTQVAQRENLQDIMDDMMNDTNIALPEDLTIEFIWPTAKAQYADALAYHDKKIRMAILGETLTGSEGDRVGSMALGNVHQETKEDNTTALRAKLAEFIQERMIKTIVNKNWKDIATYPQFVWQPRKGKVQITKVEDIKVLKEIPGFLVESDINPLRRLVDLPESDAFDNESPTILTPASSGGTPTGDGFADEPEVPGEDNPDIPAEEIEEPEFDLSPKREYAHIEEACHHFAKEVFTPWRALYSSEKAIGGIQYFQKTNQRLNKWETDIVKRTNPIFAKMRSEMVNHFNKDIAQGDKLNKAAVKNLAVPKDTYNEYIDTVRAGLGEIFVEDYVDGLKKTDNVGAGIPQKDDFPQKFAANNDIGLKNIFWKTYGEQEYITRSEFQSLKRGYTSKYAATVTLTPLPDQETLATIEKWTVAGNWEKAKKARIRLATAEAVDATDKFWITDVVDDDILANVKRTINAGIQSGTSSAAIADNIKRVFDPYTTTGTISNPSRIRTLVRTNITTARNDALQAAFRDPESMLTHPMQMFSAILDDVTTEQCRVLDGEIYRADDPIWARIKPPLDFNCRSETVPVMADDEDFLKQGLAGAPPLQLIPKGFGGTKAPKMRVA